MASTPLLLLFLVGALAGRKRVLDDDKSKRVYGGDDPLKNPILAAGAAKVAKESKEVKEYTATAILAAPLKLPLRHITGPHGIFGAKRWNNPNPKCKGKCSQAFPYYKGQLPRLKPHMGIDLETHDGESVFAVGNGKIIPHGQGVGGIELALLLDESLIKIVYADLAKSIVHVGKIVKEGDRIAIAGKFIHIQVQPPGFDEPVNPTGIIPYDFSSPLIADQAGEKSSAT